MKKVPIEISEYVSKRIKTELKELKAKGIYMNQPKFISNIINSHFMTTVEVEGFEIRNHEVEGDFDDYLYILDDDIAIYCGKVQDYLDWLGNLDAYLVNDYYEDGTKTKSYNWDALYEDCFGIKILTEYLITKIL